MLSTYRGIYTRYSISGASSRITTNVATALSAVKRFSGSRVLAYYYSGAVYTSVYSTSWSAPASRFSLSGVTSLELVETPSGTLELYLGTASAVYVSTSTDGTTWTTPDSISSTSHGPVAYIYNHETNIETVLMTYSTTVLRARTREVGGSWGAEALYFTFASANYSWDASLDANGKIHAIYEKADTSKKLYDAVISGGPTGTKELGTLVNYSGGLDIKTDYEYKLAVLMWVPDDSTYLGYMTRDSYAQIGAGIIESYTDPDTGIHVEKRGDGSMVMSLYEIVTDQAISTAYGTLLFQGTRVYTFPEAFIDDPVPLAGAFKWGTGASWGTLGGASKTTITTRGFDITSRAVGTSCTISWAVIGRWRA